MLVWWMEVNYELFCVTLCTRSVLLVIHSLGYIFSLIYTIPHTNLISAGVHTLIKKVVLAAFLVVIHQTMYTLPQNKRKIGNGISFAE